VTGLLHVEQDGPVDVEAGPFLAEQKRAKVGSAAQLVGVDLLDEPYPCAFNQVSHQLVKGPQAVSDSGFQGDPVATVKVVVQESQPLVPNGLQFPQRHLADYLIDLSH
jgi:hypothetical protein